MEPIEAVALKQVERYTKVNQKQKTTDKKLQFFSQLIFLPYICTGKSYTASSC